MNIVMNMLERTSIHGDDHTSKPEGASIVGSSEVLLNTAKCREKSTEKKKEKKKEKWKSEEERTRNTGQREREKYGGRYLVGGKYYIRDGKSQKGERVKEELAFIKVVEES